MLQKSNGDILADFPSADIPELPSGGFPVGAAGEARWDSFWATDRRAILSVGETFQVSVHVTAVGSRAAVRLLSNLNHAQGSAAFDSLDLIMQEPGVYTFQAKLLRAGRFLVYGQYTMNGTQWFWMRGEPLLLVVYPLQLRGLRMYIMIPNAAGPITHWTRHLDQIAALGFNMIHLLPLTAQGCSQSPYAARELFTLEPDLVDPGDSRTAIQQWEDFVIAARRRNIGLCLDLVLNHIAIDSELARQHPDWIVPDEQEDDGLKRAGFQAADGWQKWRDLALVHYAHPNPETRQAIWNYFRAYALYWARYAAHTRGMVRLDNLHSTHPLFAMSLTRELRQHFPDLAILGEFFNSHEDMRMVVQNYEIDLFLATPWEHHFAHDLRRYLRYLHETRHSLPWFCPVNSHDSGPPAEEFASVLSTRPRYVISACLSTGATGLSQGVELGVLHKIQFIGRQPAMAFAPGQDFRPLVRIVNSLIAEHPCFWQSGGIRFIDSNHPAVIAAIRFDEENTDDPVFVIIANLDINHAQSLSLDFEDPLLKQRDLYELLTNQPIQPHSPQLLLQLEPCGARIVRATTSKI
jgi:starch synthase (maltosyl-transferring)